LFTQFNRLKVDLVLDLLDKVTVLVDDISRLLLILIVAL
jgi:hypothetical protein